MSNTTGLATNADEIMLELRKLIEAKGDQSKAAISMGISPQYLCDVLKGRRGISNRMASRLGFRRVVSFQREETK